MRDLDAVALALPHVTKEVTEDGRPSYLVHGKWFCFHRRPRADAIDPETGKRLDDVLVFRVDGLDLKELMVSDERGIFFTTPSEGASGRACAAAPPGSRSSAAS
jgi:hypothetical protein